MATEPDVFIFWGYLPCLSTKNNTEQMLQASDPALNLQAKRQAQLLEILARYKHCRVPTASRLDAAAMPISLQKVLFRLTATA